MERPYTLEEINTLSPELVDELYKIVKSRHDIVHDKQAQNIAIWSAKEHKCPYCGSLHIVKNGHRPNNGSQKFKCKDCKHSFSTATKSVGQGIRTDYCKWINFVSCELLGLSIRTTAKTVKVHPNTILLWRHKFYDAIRYLQERKLGKEFEVDAKNIALNFKGERPKNMPRKPKERAGSTQHQAQGTSACIISAIDENGTAILRIGGFGNDSVNRYLKVLTPVVEEGSLMITDDFNGFPKVAEALKCNLEQVSSKYHKNKSGYTLSRINALHSELENFLKRYHGISSKHL